MSISRIDIHGAKQVFIHVMPVRVWIRSNQPHIFVQVKGAAERKIELLLLVELDQMPVHALHRFARGQTQHQVGIGPQIMGHNARD